MSKVYTYMIMALSIMLIMTFLGMETGFTNLFEIVGFSFSSGEISAIDIGTSSLYDSLFSWDWGVLLAAIGGSIAIGLIAKFSGENLILLPFVTGTLVLFLQTFAGIMNQVITGSYDAWVAAVVVTIFLPITIGMVVSLAEWFRGTDN